MFTWWQLCARVDLSGDGFLKQQRPTPLQRPCIMHPLGVCCRLYCYGKWLIFLLKSASCTSAVNAAQVLVEQSLIGWKEFELEVMRDLKDNCMIVCSIENVDPMGVHTGDSITVAPAQTLTDKEYQRLRDASIAIIREMGVECGGSNVQMAINPVDGKG